MHCEVREMIQGRSKTCNAKLENRKRHEGGGKQWMRTSSTKHEGGSRASGCGEGMQCFFIFKSPQYFSLRTSKKRMLLGKIKLGIKDTFRHAHFILLKLKIYSLSAR
jgi:hypothetical protein